MPFRLPSDLVLDPERGFRIYEGVVVPDWTDRNGHMNVVYYRRAFDQATQHMLSRIGLWDNDNDYGSTFALEDHVTYQHELHPGRPFFVTYQLLDFSDKLVHAFLRLFGEPGVPRRGARLCCRRTGAGRHLRAHRRLRGHADPPVRLHAGRVLRTPSGDLAPPRGDAATPRERPRHRHPPPLFRETHSQAHPRERLTVAIRQPSNREFL